MLTNKFVSIIRLLYTVYILLPELPVFIQIQVIRAILLICNRNAVFTLAKQGSGPGLTFIEARDHLMEFKVLILHN